MPTMIDPAPAPAAPRSPIAAPPRQHRRTASWVAGITLLAVVARLPFLDRALGSDEGGLLLIASQWSPGTSLYGSYWVDRPPLLIDFFTLVHLLGGSTVMLRVLGLGLVVAAVALAGRVGSLVGGSARACAATAAIFLVNPLLGVHEINGELIATPFVLAGIVAALEASSAHGVGRRRVLLVLAGALGAAAVLVKQNEIDVLVLVAVGSLTFLRAPGGARPAWRALLLAAAGAVGLTTVVLLQAASRGTDPVALWNAMFTFRLDATAVIHASATSTTTARLHGLLVALAVTGAPFLVLQLLRHLPKGHRAGSPDLRAAVVAVLVWEAFSIMGGGSYWLHYLICLVPGLVLAVAVTSSVPPATRWGRRGLPNPAIAFALLSCAVTVIVFLARPDLSQEDPVIGYLEAHARPGDTGLVAFGHPDYLQASGLSSPYSELWSLPVRVRDPHLSELTAVLAGNDRPDWVVTGATGSLHGWGIDASAAQPVFDRHYSLVLQLGDRRIYHQENL